MFSQHAFGERGINFDRTEKRLPDGTISGQVNLYTNNFLLDYDGSYKPFHYSEDANVIQVESDQGSFTYDKNQCAVTIYDSGHIKQNQTPLIKSDSFVLKGAAVNSNNWVSVNQINNAACQTVVTKDNNNLRIDAIKSVPNVGSFTVSWEKKFLQPLKTTLYITNNNPAWNNNKIGATETVQVPTTVTLGNQTLDLSQYDNTKLDRSWIAKHHAMVSSFTNKLNYDFTLAYPYFSNMTVLYNAGQASLAIDYLNSNSKIPVGSTISIDPVYGYNSGTNYQIVTSQIVSSSCGSPITKQSGTFNDVTIPASDQNNACTRMAYLFPIGTLNNTVIDKALLKFNATSTAAATIFPVGTASFNNLFIATSRALWNFTTTSPVYTYSAGAGGIKLKATILSEEKNYTFYRTTSTTSFNLTLSSINNFNTNFTLNGGPPVDTVLNVTGGQVKNLYLNGVITNSNIHYIGGVNVLTIGSKRNVEVEFSTPGTGISTSCNINSVNDNPSVSSPATIWNDIGGGTSLASNVQACKVITPNAIVNLGANGAAYIQSRVNNAVTNNWATIGIMSSNETRATQTSSTSFGAGSVQLFVTYHASTPSAPINVQAIGKPNKNTITYLPPNFKGSSSITNYNLYRSTIPFAQYPLPNGQGSDTNTNYPTYINMSQNKLLLHFDEINQNMFNDSSGNKAIQRLPNPTFANNKPVGYWKFDQLPTQTYFNKATFVNSTFSAGHNADSISITGSLEQKPGKIGNATLFGRTGVTSFVTLNANSVSSFAFMHQPNQLWTFTTWYNVTNIHVSQDMSIFSDATGGGGNIGFGIRLMNSSGLNKLEIYLKQPGLYTCDSAAGFFTTTSGMHFLAITANTTGTTNNFAFSIDNGPVQTCDLLAYVPSSSTTSTNPAQIGADSGGAVPWFGYLDEMTVFNSKLTTSQITQLYNTGKGLGLFYNPTIHANGKFTNGGYFDGSASMLNFTSTILPKGTKPFTILSWDKFNNTQYPLTLLGFKTSTDKTTINLNSSYASIYSNSQFLLQCAKPRNAGSWSFDAFTYDGSTAKYYSNGTLACSNPTAMGINTPTNNNYTIGIDPKTNHNLFNGTLDDYAVLNRTMTATEIVNAWMRGNTTLQLMKEVGNVTTIDDLNLGNGTNFYYRVQAINSNGNGTISDVTNATTATVPAKPLSLTVLTVSNNRNDLSCVPGSNGGNPITGYQVLRNGTMLINSTSALCTLYTDQPINVFDVQNYSVAAWNSVGRGPFKSVLSTGLGPTVPSPVSDLSATSITDTTVSLAWSQPNLNGQTLKGYQINYTTPIGIPKTIIINNTGTGTTNYIVSSLNSVTFYSFRIGVWTTTSSNPNGNILSLQTSQGFIPANFTVGSINVTSTNPIKISQITFTRTDTGSTSMLAVTYPSSMNLGCTMNYQLAQTSKTYSGLAKTPVAGGLVQSTFQFNNATNDVTTVKCTDSVTKQNATYVMSLLAPNMPLIAQIKAFKSGTYGTTGQLGVIDLVTLIVLILAMVGLNRVNETAGAIIMVMFIGFATYFGLIAWPIAITAGIAVVLLTIVTSTKKLPWS